MNNKVATVIRTYKYRLYPNEDQTRQLDFLLWQGRQVYNAALEQRITVYQETGQGITYPGQWAHFPRFAQRQPGNVGSTE